MLSTNLFVHISKLLTKTIVFYTIVCYSSCFVVTTDDKSDKNVETSMHY